MVKIRKNLVPSSKYSIKSPYTMNAEYITYHNTYNDATAWNEISYMISNNNQVSYHFAVDDKEVVQGLPTNRNGWHAGDGGSGTGNRKSIGVEVCFSKSGGDRYYKAEKNANKFIAQLLHERGWGVNKVKRHFDWSKKNCPHRILNEGRWSAVLSDIQAELDKLTNTPSTSTKPKTGSTSKPQSKPQTSNKTTKPNYNTKSIVEFLASINQPYSLSHRKKLASYYNVGGGKYSGGAAHNLQLLDLIQNDFKKNGKLRTASKPKGNLKVDGYLGKLTIRALQRYFGTPVDGVISKPSLVIKALQRLLGVKQDGYMGKVTITALQKRFGTVQDGKISKPSLVIKELQRRLNRGKL